METGQPLQVQAYLTGMKTMAHSWRIAFDTMENIPPERIAYFMERVNKLGWLTFSVHQIEATDILDLPEIKTDDRKTPSQRLRATLFRNWEQNNEGIETFEVYYSAKMEKLINHFKEKLT